MYMILVNKVKISHKLIDLISKKPEVLNIDRLVIWYTIYKSDLLGPELVSWLEQSNLINILV